MSGRETAIERIREFNPSNVAEHETNFLIALAQGKVNDAFTHYSKKLQSLYQLSSQSADDIATKLKTTLGSKNEAALYENLFQYYGKLSHDTGLGFSPQAAVESARLQIEIGESVIATSRIDSTTLALGLSEENIKEGYQARTIALIAVQNLAYRISPVGEEVDVIIFDENAQQNVQTYIEFGKSPSQDEIMEIRTNLEKYYAQVKSALSQS